LTWFGFMVINVTFNNISVNLIFALWNVETIIFKEKKT
jgi:hypothetical protein